MGASYHQFCPVAKAMELLDERWTLLLVRELLVGPAGFNELRRGLPRMSPTLLTKRLAQLVRAGVVERIDGEGYRMTSAGAELLPVVEALGAWGVRWVGELGDADLDPKLLMWDLHRNVPADLVPPGRLVVAWEFSGVPRPHQRRWWMVLAPGGVDVCDFDPGFDVAVTVAAELRSMVQIWRGDLNWPQALQRGDVVVHGQQRWRRAVPEWFAPSRFAAVPRPA
jgi:DNA-binding HxlR family transcriptional regulator